MKHAPKDPSDEGPPDLSCRQCGSDQWRACELLYSILQSVPDILFYKDLNGVYMGGNERLVEVTGRPLKDIVGKTDRELFASAEAEHYLETDAAMKAAQQPFRSEEWVVYPNGRRVACDTYKSPLYDSQGKLAGVLGISRDVTERKLAEERLRASEANWASLFSSLRDLLFILDYGGQILSVNPMALDALGYTEEELVGKPFLSLCFGHDPTEAAAGFLETVSKRLMSFDLPLVSKRGAHVFVDTRFSFGQWNGEEALFAVSRDISERIKSERAYQRLNVIQRHLMRLATEFVNVPVERQDQAIQQALATIGGLTKAERAYVFIYDFAQGTMKNTHEWCAPGISHHMHELQQVPLAISVLLEPHSRGEAVRVNDVETIITNDEIRAIVERKRIKSLVTIPLLAEGKCIGYVGFEAVTHKRVWDEDEIALLRVLAELFSNFFTRKNTEEELRRINDEQGMLLDTIDAQIFYITPADTYGLVNCAHAEFLGLSKGQLKNRPRDEFVPPHKVDEFRAIRRRVFATGQPEHVQAWLPNSRGEMRLLEASFSPKKSKDGRRVEYVVVVAYDITEMKRLQEGLERARDEATAAAKAKDLFLANMSHEIRTPLNAILGYAQLLSRSCRSCTASRQGIETILKSGEHLLSLLNDVLLTVRNDSLPVHLEPTDFDFHELLSEIRLYAIAEPSSAALSISSEWSGQVPRWLRADRGKIRQVLINLVTNALKFTEHGSVCVRADLAVPFLPDAAQPHQATRLRLAVRVTDTGRGISEEFQPQLFEPFTQAAAADEKRFGVGLGLPISCRLAVALGGDIAVQSAVGKGSTFCFTFEAERGRSPEHGVGRAEHIVGLAAGEAARRVLVVDDDEANRLMLQKLLKGAGFEPCLAAGGKEALEALAQDRPFDVVMMDKRMPGLDGLETSRRIRAMPARKSLPILLVTAADASEIRGWESGGDVSGVVNKPLSRAQLLLEIQRVTGVRYRYETDGEGPLGDAADASGQPLEDSLLRGFEPGFGARMEKALSRGDIAALREAVGAIREKHPLLAERLMKLVQRYDYDGLRNVLSLATHGDENEKS